MRRIRLRHLGPLAVAAISLLSASPAAAATIGSDLFGTADTGVCPLATAGERTCTVAQSTLAPRVMASGGLVSRTAGTVTRWRVRTDGGTLGTTAVALRLRTLDGSQGGPRTPFVELPLGEPGVYSFPANLPIEPEQQVGLDVRVSGNGLAEASAPLVDASPEVGVTAEWDPPLAPGASRTPDFLDPNRELLLNADVIGDTRPPRTKLTFPNPQDFLAAKQVLVRVRANEPVSIFASGQLELPNSIWGIYSKRAHGSKGQKVALRLRIPPKARRAAAEAFTKGRKVIAKVTVSATDRASNESGATVASIRQKR
ncbi:MAG: hypothetical protein ACJ75T_10930 [Solirubrobacterales bacterium]